MKMDDIRRMILWAIFGVSLVMLWDHWQVYNGRPATFFPTATTAASAPGKPAGQPPAVGDAALPQATGTQPSAATPRSSAAGADSIATAAAPVMAVQEYMVTTDLFKLTFSSEGGTIVRSELLKYPESAGSKQNVVLLGGTEGIYQAQSGLIGGPFPNHKTPMTFSGERSLPDGQNELSVRFESPVAGGVKLIKTYTLTRGSYVIDVRDEIVNEGGEPLSPELYFQFVRDGSQVAGATAFYSSFTGPAFYSEGSKFQKVTFKDIDKGKASFAKDVQDGYVAMVQHYFASVWLPEAGVEHQNFVRKMGSDRYSAGLIMPLGTLAPGASASNDMRLLIGPQEDRVLKETAPGLELLRDYGYVTILAVPIYWLLAKIHGFLGNWGWSIVALVFLLKVAFYWLNAKAYGSMAKMKALNPKVQAMRERLKDNPKQMQMEMMRIYREEKVNPLGGCLPIAVQIPFFIALYWVLLAAVEMRGAPWILWVQDLSVKDPFFILPILMTLTTLLQTALNPTPPDPTQAKLMWIMPLAFSVMFFLFPAGLVLYWFTNNLLSIAQQWLINTRMGVPPSFHLPDFLRPKKSGAG